MKKRIVSLLLALALLVLPVLPALAAEEDSYTYVALGDSICAGIGLTTVQYAHNLMGVDVSFNFKGYPETCYVGQVGKSLNLDRDHAINLGLPGVMSKDMLELVKTGTMAEMNTLSGCQYNYPEFVDYIKSADVISIQLGSNDAFVPIDRSVFFLLNVLTFHPR